MWYACLYEVDKAYGGPEEGGWYYDTGRPLVDGFFNDRTDDLSCYFATTRDAVRDYKRLNQAAVDLINEENRKSGNHTRYDIRIGVGVPKRFPEVKPHYE